MTPNPLIAKIKEIKNLLSANRIQDALAILEWIIRDMPIEDCKEYEQSLVLLKNEYRRYQNDLINNVLYADQQNIERNKIVFRILGLLYQIEVSNPKFFRISEEVEEGIERTRKIAEYARLIYYQGGQEIIRQKGGFSSFSIPNREVAEQIWETRKGSIHRSDTYHHYQKEERVWLEKIAKNTYCKIIIFPNLILNRGQMATQSRIKTLVEFIESNKDIVDVVTLNDEKQNEQENLLIVGNSFYCESQKADSESGYKDSIFEFDEQAIGQKIKAFDDEFNKLLDGKDTYQSREKALDELKKALNDEEQAI
jgi:hypothetical protein